MSFYIATITFSLSIKEIGGKKVIRFFYSTHEEERSRFLFKSRLGNDFSFLKYNN